MGKRVEITINGKAYPCQTTMGAMLRFREATGREVTAMEQGNLADMLTFLWCCVQGACNRERIPFDMPLMDFSDAIDPEDMVAVVAQMQTEPTATTETGKKKASRR